MSVPLPPFDKHIRPNSVGANQVIQFADYRKSRFFQLDDRLNVPVKCTVYSCEFVIMLLLFAIALLAATPFFYFHPRLCRLAFAWMALSTLSMALSTLISFAAR